MWSSFQGSKGLVHIDRDVPRPLREPLGAIEVFSKLDNERLGMTIPKVERRRLKDHTLDTNNALRRVIEELYHSHWMISAAGTTKGKRRSITGSSELMGSV